MSTQPGSPKDLALLGPVPGARLGSRGTALLVFLLLGLQAAMLAWPAYRDSPAYDEVGHFAAGLSHWRTGTFHLYHVNPPLARCVALAPVALLMKPQYELPAAPTEDPLARPEFTYGTKIAHANGTDYFGMVTVARWASIPFSLVAGLICFLWASELYGRTSGLLALTLWTFCPNALGYGHLITPDMAATGFGVAALYVLWKWLKRPTWGWALLAGVLLGVAELSKAVWVILFGLWPCLWLLYRLFEGGSRRSAKSLVNREALQMTVILGLGLWILNLGYGFEGSLKPLDSYRFVSASLAGETRRSDSVTAATGNRFSGTWLGRLPVPVPKDYLLGIDHQKVEFEQKMWSYLRGEWRRGGWWYYYLYALLVKVPCGTWVLFVLGVMLTVARWGYAAPVRDELLLLLPAAAVLVLISSQTGFNHHVRYVLPVLPFMFVFISKVARSVSFGHRLTAAACGSLLLWSVASSVRVYPHSISYFNELAGGPRNGHSHLVDSNIDWGQDLLYLKRWLKDHPQATPLYLAYSHPFLDASLAEIESPCLPPLGPHAKAAARLHPGDLGPMPGWYAVSVNQLHRQDRAFDYFLEFEPVATAGYSIYIYHLAPKEVEFVRKKLGIADQR